MALVSAAGTGAARLRKFRIQRYQQYIQLLPPAKTVNLG